MQEIRSFLDQFGNGLADTIWPSKVEVVGELGFAGPEGEVAGCTFPRIFCLLLEVLSKGECSAWPCVLVRGGPPVHLVVGEDGLRQDVGRCQV